MAVSSMWPIGPLVPFITFHGGATHLLLLVPENEREFAKLHDIAKNRTTTLITSGTPWKSKTYKTM